MGGFLLAESPCHTSGKHTMTFYDVLIEQADTHTTSAHIDVHGRRGIAVHCWSIIHSAGELMLGNMTLSL